MYYINIVKQSVCMYVYLSVGNITKSDACVVPKLGEPTPLIHGKNLNHLRSV